MWKPPRPRRLAKRYQIKIIQPILCQVTFSVVIGDILPCSLWKLPSFNSFQGLWSDQKIWVGLMSSLFETTHSSDAWNPAVHAQFINVYSPFLSHVQDFSAGNRIHYKTDDIMDPLHHYMHFYPTPAEHAASKSSPTSSSSYQARKSLNVPSNSCLKGTVYASRSIEVLLNSAPLWKNGRQGAQRSSMSPRKNQTGIYIIYPNFKGTFGAKVVEVSNWQVTSSLRWVGGRGWEGWVKRWFEA